MPLFDSKGVPIPPATVLQAEKDELFAYAKVAYQAGSGLALSQLRRPGSKVSLQRVEQVVNVLVAEGKLSAENKSGFKGGSYVLYHVTEVTA